MKKVLLGISIWLGVAATASAEFWIYLGAAHSARHCQRIANVEGYRYYSYGPAFVNGLYILNACLGAGSFDGGNNNGTSGKKWFVITPYYATQEEAGRCKQQIEDRFEDVRCYLQKDYHKFECKAPASLKSRIGDMSCVRSISGPYNECVLCGDKEE